MYFTNIIYFIACDDLSIVNGSIDITGTGAGDTATFSCDDGYRLVGTSVLTCQSVGGWTASPPTCQG